MIYLILAPIGEELAYEADLCGIAKFDGLRARNYVPKSLMHVLLFLVLLSVSVAFGMESSAHAQHGKNAEGDLWGENLGDFIMMRWLAQPGAAEYIVYRAASISGPWIELFRAIEIEFGGSRVHYTPDAKKMDLCYWVEAIDTTDRVIRVYEPFCVPKFVPEK